MNRNHPAPADKVRYRFGQFEFDAAQGRLWRGGIPVRLQGQPAEVLAMLLAARGNPVTREELQQRLWPTESFGDFDTGLNTAIRKLRHSLGDSPQNPIFIETLMRVGYRFLAPIEVVPAPQDEPVSDIQESPSPVAAVSPVAVPEAGGPAISPDATSHPARPKRWRFAVAAVLALLTIVLAAAIFLGRSSSDSPADALRLQIALPAGQTVFTEVRGQKLAISADGKELFYVGAQGTSRHVYRRSLTGGDSQRIPGSEGATSLSLSADGRQLLFYRDSELWSLKLDDLATQRLVGPPLIGDVQEFSIAGADGSVYSAGRRPHDAQQLPLAEGSVSAAGMALLPDQPIYRRLPGGTWEPALAAISPSGSRGGEYQFPQQILPDGNLLFSAVWAPLDRGIYVRDWRSGSNRMLAEQAMGGHLTKDNTLLYFWQGQVLAKAPTSRGRGVSEATPIASRVLTAGWGGGHFAVSAEGTLAYLEAPEPRTSELVWVDRNGKESAIPAPARPYTLLDLSPDGEHLLVGLLESSGLQSIWHFSMHNGQWKRLVQDAPDPPAGLWSPDGKYALVNAYLGSLRFPNIAMIPRQESSGQEVIPRRLVPSEFGQFPLSWPSRSAALAYVRSGTGETLADIGLISFPQGEIPAGTDVAAPQAAPRKVLRTEELEHRVLERPMDQSQPAVSPDGKLLAYIHGLYERAEIQVCALPYCNDPFTLPDTQAATAVIWDIDSRTLFFRRGKALHEVSVQLAGSSVSATRPAWLFEGDYVPPGFWTRQMIYHQATQRFLMSRPLQEPEPIRQIHVVLNWPALARPSN